MSLPSKPQKIKVCLVSISLGKGGADRACAALSEMLSEKGFEVHLVVLNDDVRFNYKGRLLNLGLGKKGKDHLVKRFLRLRKLKNYLKTHQIDVVIDHRAKNNLRREQFYRNYIYKGLKTIYVVHSHRLNTYFGQDHSIFKNIYKDNFKTVAVSKAIEDRLTHELGLPNVAQIYNAYASQWKQWAQEPASIPEGPYFLAYGRLNDEVKDYSFLMESFELSGLSNKGVKLVIMGTGKDEDHLRSYARKLGLGEAVIFLPFASNPFPIIKGAHAVCLTSRWEGFPMVLLEALSLEIPVVSLDIASGPSEIIQHEQNGLLVIDRVVPSYAEALRRIFVDTELHDRCQQNALASVQVFSTPEISEQWRQILLNE